MSSLSVTLKLSLFLMAAFCRESLSRCRWESEVGMRAGTALLWRWAGRAGVVQLEKRRL